MRLLCDTNPMAYGSTASLVAILGELDIPVELIALGRDVSLELLCRAGLESRTIDVDVKDADAVSAIVARERPDVALVISNLSNLRVYAAANVPVFFVDVLFWYSERKDEALWTRFVEGFAIDFPGVRARVAKLDWARPPTVVGPLLRRLPADAPRRMGTLVNLGGVRSVFVTPERARAGLQIIASILRGIEPALPAGDVVIAVGGDAAEFLRPLVPDGMKVGPLSPAEYDAVLQRAALLLTVPGLNAVLEGMAAEVPLAFLPALNASACLQLRRYQQAGVGAEGIELERLTRLAIPEAVSDERALTDEVIAALEVIACSPPLLDRLTEALLAQLAQARSLVAARRAFVDSLEAPGAATIAGSLAAWWRSSAQATES